MSISLEGITFALALIAIARTIQLQSDLRRTKHELWTALDATQEHCIRRLDRLELPEDLK